MCQEIEQGEDEPGAADSDEERHLIPREWPRDPASSKG
jgi:hypothetical protein